jgi:HK97 family phage major capsid protein
MSYTIKYLAETVLPVLRAKHGSNPETLKKAIGAFLKQGEEEIPVVNEEGEPVEIEQIILVGAEASEDAEEGEGEPAPEELQLSIDAAVTKAIKEATKALPGRRVYNDAPAQKSERIPAKAKAFRSKVFTGTDADYKAYGFGQWLSHRLTGNKAASKWLAKEGIIKALGESSQTAGGSLVPDEFSNDIIRLVETFGMFRQHARVMPMTRETLTIPRVVSEGAATWVGENTDLTEADDVYNNVDLVAKKLGRITRIANELLEDAAISVADLVAQSMAQKFAEAEDDAAFNGTGTSTYGGAFGLTEKIKDGNHTASIHQPASGTLAFGDLTLAMYHQVEGILPEYARPGAKWYVSSHGFATSMSRLAIAQGGVTRMETEQGSQRAFLGYPVVIVQKMYGSASDLASEVAVLFGDLSMAATLGDRASIEIATSAERYFESDQTAIRAIERVSINVHDLGDTSDAGPIVGLQFAAS